MHGGAVHHAALAHREVGDIDHLLHFAVALGLDLAHLQRDQRTQRVLVLAQCYAAQAHCLTAQRCRDLAPGKEGVLRPLNDCRHVLGRRLPDPPISAPSIGERTAHRAARQRRRCQT